MIRVSPTLAIALLSAACGNPPEGPRAVVPQRSAATPVRDGPTREAPRRLPPGRSVVDVALSKDRTCAVLDDGSVRCWGYHLGRALVRPRAIPAFEDAVEAVVLYPVLAVRTRDERLVIGRETFARQLEVDDVRRIVGGDGDLCALDRAGRVHCFTQRLEYRPSAADVPRIMAIPQPALAIAG